MLSLSRSRTVTFETDSLSVGPHVIEFRVQDDDGEWSSPARGTVTVRATPSAMVMVRLFTVSASTIEKGDTTTLTWTVANANSVTIDNSIGDVPPAGSVNISPDATTTYTLTATGEDMTATASATVIVEEPADVIRLEADSEMSGYIRSSGDERTTGMYIGDDNANREIQGFLTYRINDIPDDATIGRVILDLSGYDLPYSSPYPGLGCLRAFVHEYSMLGGQYWSGDVSDPIEEWCSLADLEASIPSEGIGQALQYEVGETKFQLRLQFSDATSDWDETRDLLHWQKDGMPTLIVEYYLDE